MRIEIDSLGFMITGKTGTLHFFKKDRLVISYDLRTGERTVGYKFSELRKQAEKLGFSEIKVHARVG